MRSSAVAQGSEYFSIYLRGVEQKNGGGGGGGVAGRAEEKGQNTLKVK